MVYKRCMQLLTILNDVPMLKDKNMPHNKVMKVKIIKMMENTEATPWLHSQSRPTVAYAIDENIPPGVVESLA